MEKQNQPPQKMFKIVEGYAVGFFDQYEGIRNYSNLPRQRFPQSYLPNGYFDVIKKSTVKNRSDCFGDKILALETEPIIDVDTRNDLKYLQYEVATRLPPVLNVLERSE